MYKVETGAAVPAGSYDGIFKGMESFTTKDGRDLMRWKFEIEHGGKVETVNGISGADNPKLTNKFGRYLFGIAGLSIKNSAGATVGDPNNQIGQKYLISISTDDGGSQVESFLKLN